MTRRRTPPPTGNVAGLGNLLHTPHCGSRQKTVSVCEESGFSSQAPWQAT